MDEEDSSYGRGYMPPPQDSTAAIIDAVNPEHLLDTLRHRLKREVWYPEIKDWRTPEGIKPLMTDEGVESFVMDIAGILNQNTTLSNIEEKQEINLAMLSKVRTVVTKLQMRYREYDIDLAELDTILDIILEVCESCLKRPYHNLERVFHKSTLSEIRHYDPRMQAAGLTGKKEKKGWGLFGGKDK